MQLKLHGFQLIAAVELPSHLPPRAPQCRPVDVVGSGGGAGGEVHTWQAGTGVAQGVLAQREVRMTRPNSSRVQLRPKPTNCCTPAHSLQSRSAHSLQSRSATNSQCRCTALIGT